MKNEDHRGASRGRTDMRGASRRTYPVRGAQADGESYRGNGYRGGRGERGAAPRVGAVYGSVPVPRRADGARTEERRDAEAKRAVFSENRCASGERRNERSDDRRSHAAPRADAEYRRACEAETLAQGGYALASPEDARENENLLVGRNPIREALKSGRPVEKLLVAQGDLSGAARDIVRMAKEAGAVVQMVDRSRLDAIYPAHQGILAYVAAVEYKTLDDIFARAAERGEEAFLVLLDGVTDPHNLGAIIRSAECAGAHGVIVPERRAAGLGPAAAKAAAGALSYMPVARVKNLNRTIEELKERGVWIIGTSMHGENALAADLSGPVALVIGSEGEGISRLTLEKCDRTLTLPMKGSIESLNASVAAGILMYEIVRARAR